MEAAPDRVVVDGRPLAVEPRGEEDAVRAHGHRGGHVVQRGEEPFGGAGHGTLTAAGADAAGERQRITRVQHVVAQPRQARPARLVLVGDQVPALDPRRDRRDVRQGVGLLERDVTAHPARRPDVQVGVEVGHRAGPDGRGVQVAGAGDDGRAGKEAELGRRTGRQAAEDGTGRDQVRQLRALEPRQRDQRVVVGDRPDRAVVGHPVQRDGVVRRPGQARQAQAEIVDRFQKDGGGRVDLGPLRPQEVDVPDGVLAREARDPAGLSHPARQLRRRVPLDVHRPSDGLAHRLRAPGVEPRDGGPDRLPGVVDRDGARPLRGAADADDAFCGDAALLQRTPGACRDGRPPRVR